MPAKGHPKHLYMRATFPPQDMRDAKFMLIERALEKHAFQTPQELYNSLPDLRPMASEELFEAVPNHEGCYRLKPTIQDIPEMAWEQVYGILN